MSHSIKGMQTRAIHSGEIPDQYGSPHTPLYTTTTFKFRDAGELDDVIEGRKQGGLYTRYGMNPTIMSLEAKLADISEADSALIFSAGMAAISAMFLAHGSRGIVCFGEIYGGTHELLLKQLPTLGIRSHFMVKHDLAELDRHLAAGAGLVFLESPGNPTMAIVDIRKICEIAHARGALVAVDNTFASPVNQRPHALGADLVVQSATKYLGGHSDITAGVLSGSKPLLSPVRDWRKNLGQMIAPEAAHLLSRSLCTLVARVQRQNSSALAIAKALSTHPRIRRVLYPGLPDFPGHALAASQMSGFGGMLTIEVQGTAEDARKVIERLRLFLLAPSLGGVESLASQPIATSHRDMTAQERNQRGITDSMIRLSVGLEEAEDLISDLLQALEA